MKTRVQLALAAWVALPLLVVGCDYAQGRMGQGFQSGGDRNEPEAGYRWNSLYREDVQTVAVPVFTNKSFRRGVEMRLTQAVIKQLEAQAPYKVMDRERADTVLEGQITNVEVNTLYRDFRTSMPREQMLTITFDFVWKDLRNGRILAQRTDLEHTGVFYPPLGESTFVGSMQAVERLAELVVQEMQADW